MEHGKLERVSLTLSAEDRKELIEFYKHKRDKLLIALEEINRNIAELSGEPVQKNQLVIPLEYQSDWNWPKKIQYVLTRASKKLSITEVIDALAKLEPIEKNEIEAFKNRVNVAIQYQLRNADLLSRETIDNKVYIGLKEWDSFQTTNLERIILGNSQAILQRKSKGK